MDDHTSIRGLNDRARSTLFGYRVMVSQGVQVLDDTIDLLHKVRNFDAITEGNDPHGEHDFGSVLHSGETILWKFDYYDPTLSSGSESPADPGLTMRVLTIRVLTIILADV